MIACDMAGVSSIDALLDRAVAAIKCGDRPSALAAR
jgi:hypothetical protein